MEANDNCGVLKGDGGRGRKPKNMLILIIIRITIKGSFLEEEIRCKRREMSDKR